MSFNFVLVPGPLVRGTSWEPTAGQLRANGHRVQVADILADNPVPPPWSAWTSHLVAHVVAEDMPFLVGHSSASTLVVELATRLPTKGVIIVDGEVPPPQGAASPVRPALYEHIKRLAGPDGMLPVWSKWFAGDAARMSLVGLDVLAGDPDAFAFFEAELPRMHVDWFAGTIDLANWEQIPSGYIQASSLYDHAISEARRRGWPVERLQGTHLHPTLQPAETASAILSMSRRLMDE